MKTRHYLATALCLLCLFIWQIPAVVPPSSGNASYLKTTPVATNLWAATLREARVYSISACNTSGSDVWLHVFNTNSATVPNNSTPGFAPVKILSGANGGYDFGEKGCPFTRGVVAGTSSTPTTFTNGSAVFVISVVYDGIFE
jgi:hypothetical protein